MLSIYKQLMGFNVQVPVKSFSMKLYVWADTGYFNSHNETYYQNCP